MAESLARKKRNVRRFTKKQIEAHLRQLSREPFAEVLEMFLDCAPDEDAILELAQSYPERWAQSVTMIAKLAGYTEQATIEHRHSGMIALVEMSDSELHSKMIEVMGRLGIEQSTNLVELEALPTPNSDISE
ncbi:MAG: hypothetical protein ACR2P5_04680 [Gammaproteobacteria bacterium]